MLYFTSNLINERYEKVYKLLWIWRRRRRRGERGGERERERERESERRDGAGSERARRHGVPPFCFPPSPITTPNRFWLWRLHIGAEEAKGEGGGQWRRGKVRYPAWVCAPVCKRCGARGHRWRAHRGTRFVSAGEGRVRALG